MPERWTDEQVARLDELEAGLATAREALQTAGQALRDLSAEIAPNAARKYAESHEASDAA